MKSWVCMCLDFWKTQNEKKVHVMWPLESQKLFFALVFAMKLCVNRYNLLLSSFCVTSIQLKLLNFEIFIEILRFEPQAKNYSLRWFVKTIEKQLCSTTLYDVSLSRQLWFFFPSLIPVFLYLFSALIFSFPVWWRSIKEKKKRRFRFY